jgi:hypothetical protein
VNASQLLAAPRAGVVSCSLAASAALRVPVAQFPGLRRQPGPGLNQPLSFLKHADEQAVAGLAAVLKAIHEYGLSPTSFTDWGVIAGPCFLGRQTSVDALARYLEEGAFGISPHLIPHQSLHAISGTISQALGIRGPNFGVGGGPGAAAETMLTAATLLAGNALPGLWVVLTDYERERIPLAADRASAPAMAMPDCLSAALALVPATADGPALEICPIGALPSDVSAHALDFDVPSFVSTLSESNSTSDWRLPGQGWLRLQGDDRCD